MSTLKVIRSRLGVTQVQLAKGLGVSQGNVSFYERGQTIPPAVVGKLISFAAGFGVTVTYDDVYVEEVASTASDQAAPAGEGVAHG